MNVPRLRPSLAASLVALPLEISILTLGSNQDSVPADKGGDCQFSEHVGQSAEAVKQA